MLLQCVSTWGMGFAPFMSHVSEGHRCQGDENCAARGTLCSDGVIDIVYVYVWVYFSEVYIYIYMVPPKPMLQLILLVFAMLLMNFRG